MPITPEDLRGYTTFKSVKKRPDEQLKMDILEAESYIDSRIENPLHKYDDLPDKLKIAWLKVAQFYALINGDESIAKGYKSEKIGDYSYTLADGSSMSMPDISNLLEEFLPPDEKKSGGFFMRIRPL